MNQGRLWTVVSPNVGLPLVLGSVALMSFTVHLAVLNHSSWYKDFFNGNLNKTASAEEIIAPANADVAKVETSVMSVEVAEAPLTDTGASFIVKIKPKDAL